MYPKYFKDSDSAVDVFATVARHENRRANTSRPLLRQSVRVDRIERRGTKDPAKADEVYQSGVRWLLDHTRPDDGKKFDLLFRDNIAYGFRRNALGARALRVFIAIGCLAWALAKEHVLFGAGGKTVDWSKLGGILPEPNRLSRGIWSNAPHLGIVRYED
jgi:hypothetical protein